MHLIGSYTTKSDRFFFQWAFVEMDDGEVRAYIALSPGSGNRKVDGHSTHRHFDDDGCPYVCYDPVPDNLDDAIVIAEEWAERTESYILHNIFF